MPQWWLHNPLTLLTALTILLITHEICNNLLQSSLLCFRGNPHVLDEELQRKFLIQLKDEQILYKWWFTHISLPSFVWSMYMCMLMSWESTCSECVVQIQLKTCELIPNTIPVLRLFQRQLFLCKALYCKLIAKSHKFLLLDVSFFSNWHFSALFLLSGRL